MNSHPSVWLVTASILSQKSVSRGTAREIGRGRDANARAATAAAREPLHQTTAQPHAGVAQLL